MTITGANEGRRLRPTSKTRRRPIGGPVTTALAAARVEPVAARADIGATFVAIRATGALHAGRRSPDPRSGDKEIKRCRCRSSPRQTCPIDQLKRYHET
jgi:hypothetical protein